MGDEAELGPALKGSVPTLDLLENWHLFESPAGARYTSFRRRQAQWPSFASSPGHSVSKRILRSWCHIFHCVARRAHRASCTSRATTTAALGAQGLSSSGTRVRPPTARQTTAQRRERGVCCAVWTRGPLARGGPCCQIPIAAPKSALAARTLRSVRAALEATSGSAASPPCAPER